MPRIAVDVVLLPPEDVMVKTIKWNKEIISNYDRDVILDKKTCLPHISLAMGVIEENDLPNAKLVLEQISKDFYSLDLKGENIYTEITPNKKISSCLEIKKTKEIQALHEIVMKRMFPYFSYDVKKNMFFNPDEVNEVSLHWVKNYAKKLDNPTLFLPHISLGMGELKTKIEPIRFTASTIALCQLGNYCTCRKVLISHKLKSKNGD